METEGTVTIGLKRYDELIAKEKAIDKKLTLVYSYGYLGSNVALRVHKPNKVIKMLTETIDGLNKYIDSLNKEINKLEMVSTKDKKGWW